MEVGANGATEEQPTTRTVEVTEPEPIEEFYANAVQVHVGAHDVLVEFLREGPGAAGTERIVVGRLRTPISSAWTFCTVLTRLLSKWVSDHGMFALPAPYLEQVGLIEEYEELAKLTKERP